MLIYLGQQQSTQASISGETSNYTDIVKIEDNIAYGPVSDHALDIESSYAAVLEYDYIHVEVPTDV